MDTHHNFELLLDTISHEAAPDGCLHLDVMQPQLQGHDDEGHSPRRLGFQLEDLLVALFGSGGTAKGWVVHQLHTHLQGTEMLAVGFR